MATKARRVAVGTGATLLLEAEGDYQRVVVRNNGSAAVDLGPATVTSGAGFSLPNGTQIGPIDIPGGDSLYGIVAAATQDVHVLEFGSD